MILLKAINFWPPALAYISQIEKHPIPMLHAVSSAGSVMLWFDQKSSQAWQTTAVIMLNVQVADYDTDFLLGFY